MATTSPLIIVSLILFSLVLNLPSSASLKSFNVVSFGAWGDGKADSTNAFLHAWESACSALGYVQIYVPRGRYVLRPLNFEGGKCKSSSILFTIDGTIIAAGGGLATSSSWIVFHQVNGLHIKGGAIDAKGKSLWDCKMAHRQCPKGATSLGFDNSKNIVVEGLMSLNSQMFHITANACENLKFVGLKILAHRDSPNTDGIHLERSTQISITDSDIRTGDDCISIGPDNKHVWIEHVHCGPGHGISIGSLGKSGRDYGVLVQNVTVQSVNFTSTDNGLRIKTWASPSQGLVQGIRFSNARMVKVRNPIIIDQNYCPHFACAKGQASGIQIDDVSYRGIYGTTASPVALMFDCSPKHPCKGLTLQNIQLSHPKVTPVSECKNAYGKTIGPIQPSSCLH